MPIDKLTAANVEEVLEDVLFLEGEDQAKAKEVPGILHTYRFHPARLEARQMEIEAMLRHLPDSFMKSKGGGMSFLNACFTKDDEHWGEHMDMERLFALGQAIGRVSLALPKELWSRLPGGMPYYIVDL